MKHSLWTKRDALTELRGLLNAIEATNEPNRIAIHLKDIKAIAQRIETKRLYLNLDW